jgi:hypothetical protein
VDSRRIADQDEAAGRSRLLYQRNARNVDTPSRLPESLRFRELGNSRRINPRDNLTETCLACNLSERTKGGMHRMTSPASTGGSGALFEAQVGAAYLLSMLLEVDARGLPNCRIESIRLQRGQEGYPLDDVIIQGRDRGGKAATLEIQVKRSITFAPSDEVFQDVVKQVKDAMHNPGFWANHHQLAVAIARTTQKIERAYQDVLSWARNIEDATTFHARLNRQGEANDAMRSFVSMFRHNLKAAGAPDDNETVWEIFRRFHILVFDFTAPDSASAELMHERALRALDSGGIDEARNLWSRLTELALQIAANAGHRTIADLASFRFAPSRDNRKALASISEESQSALSDINDEVSGVRLMRRQRVDAVREAMTRARYVEIRGEAGVGKSGVLRRLAEDLNTEAQVLVLSPNRVIESGWLSMKAARQKFLRCGLQSQPTNLLEVRLKLLL